MPATGAAALIQREKLIIARMVRPSARVRPIAQIRQPTTAPVTLSPLAPLTVPRGCEGRARDGQQFLYSERWRLPDHHRSECDG